MNIFDPETEQIVKDIARAVLVDSCEHYYRYHVPNENGGPAWFYQTSKVPPHVMLTLYPGLNLQFDGCEGLLPARELKPGYVLEDGHGGIKPEPE